MTSEETGQTIIVKTAEAAPVAGPEKAGWKCPTGDRHVHSEDLKKVWKECHEESFWYRALPFSLGSMAVTGGLLYKGVWNASKRFGPFPKLAVAGVLGYAVGKASYVGTCRSKFQDMGLEGRPGFGPWSGAGPWSGPGPRSCHHVCEECKKTAPAVSAEQLAG